ncbi:dihydrofolate reductase family protein [Pseudonocardia sp. CA-107938]|uniref:dihydrofolate reductase family protein n=1 Tax=Pseudonocardia sp. CA-107938 TaxID=3240021 RepID=UPI003D919B14
MHGTGEGSGGTVRWHVTMSLDGFVAGTDHDMSWMSLNWLPRQEGWPEPAERVLGSLGAILGGRGWYEASRSLNGVEGIYGGRYDGPVLVLTHHPEPAPYDPRISFVTGGIEPAVAAAQAAAHGRDVVLFGADIAAQALAADLVDEIVVHTAPVLLGAGVRLTVHERVELEPLHLGHTGPLADLHYRVRTAASRQ